MPSFRTSALRRGPVPLACALALALPSACLGQSTGAAASSPAAEVSAAMARLAAKRTYRIAVTMLGPPSPEAPTAIDFTAPDRYRVLRGNRVLRYAIGDTYLQVDGEGRHTRVALSPGRTSDFADPARLRPLAPGRRVVALGTERLAAGDAYRYAIDAVAPHTPSALLWIGTDGLPLQLRTEVSGAPVLLRYQRFDDPGLRFDAPP